MGLNFRLDTPEYSLKRTIFYDFQFMSYVGSKLTYAESAVKIGYFFIYHSMDIRWVVVMELVLHQCIKDRKNQFFFNNSLTRFEASDTRDLFHLRHYCSEPIIVKCTVRPSGIGAPASSVVIELLFIPRP